MNPRLSQVLWIGPRSAGLGWLFRRVDEYLPTVHVDRWSIDGLLPEELACVERIIIACPTRLDDPRGLCDGLALNHPEIPRAIATESWWEGSRRTGLGDSGQLLLPWYRWWDGWRDWLDGSSPALLAPLVAPLQTWIAFQPRPMGLMRPLHGLIVANCHQTAEAWKSLAALRGHSAETLNWREFSQAEFQLACSHDELRWILWDDSCLDLQAHLAEELRTCLFVARRRCPRAVVCLAEYLPRVDVLESLARLGRVETLVKPTAGSGLLRFLEHLPA